ncbi:TRAP transporter substrate-binding protein DctP [Marinobacter sp.]|uniref:TRAP transporter substrate-binding protein DctP n=1 Tax=Marinobacter sp. TaxID=50741 RepID=UPI003851669E
MTTKLKLLGTVMAAMALGTSGYALAEQITLKTASAFSKGTAIPYTFEKFVKEINSDTGAPVKLNYIGGPEVMPAFELGNAVRTGVVDVAFVTSAFYTNLLPAANALNLTQYSPQELRETGRWEDLQNIWQEQMNVHYLAFTNYGNRFHLYTNKEINSADLSGQRLRITPVYRAFFEDLGADVAQTSPGEVYTALERGTVDGYGWPIQGILDLGWHEHTKYRVDPGFYQVEVGVLVNQDAWERMNDEQREYLTEKAVWLESLNDLNEEINEREAKRQAEAGVQVIELEGPEREKFLKTAYEAQWEALSDQAPENTKKLRAILDK